MRSIFIFCLLIICQSAFSAIVLDVQIISKRGMGKGLVLESELQESLVFYRRAVQTIELGNGIQMDFAVKFDTALKQIGPSSKVFVKGRLFNEKGEVLNDFFENPVTIELGSVFETDVADGTDHLVRVKITPTVSK